MNMAKNSRIVLCPHCDREHRVGMGGIKIKCGSCMKVFSAQCEKSGHNAGFWHNPETAIHF